MLMTDTTEKRLEANKRVLRPSSWLQAMMDFPIPSFGNSWFDSDNDHGINSLAPGKRASNFYFIFKYFIQTHYIQNSSLCNHFEKL